MKILIDIGHPAHVHYYKNFTDIMQKRGHKVLFIARDRDVVIFLMKYYNLNFVNRGKGGKTLLGKVIYAIYVYALILYHTIKFSPDFIISQGGVYTAPIAWLMKKPHISTEDTESAHISHIVAKIFSSFILTPNCFYKELGRKQIRVNSYSELFYLHPKYFVPQKKYLKELSIKENEKYFIIRFVSWNSHHDIGHSGLSDRNKIKIVEDLSRFGKVLILSEKKLPKELERYTIKVSPPHLHDVMAFATLLFGESATMASESACLGVPAIYIDNSSRGYTLDEEKWGLVYNFAESPEEQDNAIEKAISIVENYNSSYFSKLWEKMLQSKIDYTQFLVEFIENYNNKTAIK